MKIQRKENIMKMKRKSRKKWSYKKQWSIKKNKDIIYYRKSKMRIKNILKKSKKKMKLREKLF